MGEGDVIHAPSFTSCCQQANRACASAGIFRHISARVSSEGTLSPAHYRALVSVFSAPCVPEKGEGRGVPCSRELWCLLGRRDRGCSHLCSPHMKSLQSCLCVVPVSLPIGSRLCCLHHMPDLDDLQCYHGNGFCLSIGENVS